MFFKHNKLWTCINQNLISHNDIHRGNTNFLTHVVEQASQSENMQKWLSAKTVDSSISLVDSH